MSQSQPLRDFETKPAPLAVGAAAAELWLMPRGGNVGGGVGAARNSSIELQNLP